MHYPTISATSTPGGKKPGCAKDSSKTRQNRMEGIKGVVGENQQFLLWCILVSLTAMDIVEMF